MNVATLNAIEQVVGLGLYQETWTHTAIVVAPRLELEVIHERVRARWQTLVAGISSAIAHMDYDDPNLADAEKSYAESKPVVIVHPSAAPPQGVRRVIFIASEVVSIPDGVDLAFCLLPIDVAWRKS
jgi:hypothetical protein